MMIGTATPIEVRISASSDSAITLGIAVAGLLLAMASLVWQWVTFRLNGPRLKLVLKRGYSGGGQLVSALAELDSTAVMAMQ